MPIYDYVCAACGHRAEILHGVHEHGPNFCPECGAEGTMRKAIAAPTIHFKGTGWAKKDRAAGSRTKAAAKGDGEPSSGDKPAADKPSADAPSDKPATPPAPAGSD